MSRTLKKRDGDVVVQTSRGQYLLIEGIHKLSQDAADALMTEYDPERKMGSQLSNLGKLNGQANAAALGMVNRGYVKSLVRDALERLRAQQNTRVDQLSSTEAISVIGTVRVVQLSKTGYLFSVDITPVSGPDISPTTFLIQLRHQFLASAKPDLPGSFLTDDRSL
jgi:hypothetical protein